MWLTLFSITLLGQGVVARSALDQIEASPALGAALKSALHESWVWVGEHEGGFQDIPNLSEPPSLFFTAWNLTLDRIYGLAVPNLSVDQAAAWLHSVIEEPALAIGYPPLGAIQASVQAMYEIGRAPNRDVVSNRVGQFWTNRGYRWSDQESASWAASAAATKTLTLADSEIPPDVVHFVAEQLPTLTAIEPTERVDPDEFLAAWLTAINVLPIEDRLVLKGSLQSRLNEIAEILNDQECTGSKILDAHSIATIAKEHDFTSPIPSIVDCFDDLETPTGYLALYPGGPGDPLVSARAADLGRSLTPRLADTLVFTAGPLGWRDPGSGAEPDATYFGVMIGHAFGWTERDEPLRDLVALWVEDLQAACADPEDFRFNIVEKPYIPLLARELEIELPLALIKECQTLLDNEQAWNSWDTREQSVLVRFANVSNLSVPASLIASIIDSLEAEPLRTDDALTVLVFLNDVAPSTEREAAIEALALSLAVGDGGYGHVPEVPVPNLRTTLTALYAIGGIEEEGPTAHTIFKRDGQTWGYPPGSEGTPYYSLETLYLGLVLDGRIAVGDSVP